MPNERSRKNNSSILQGLSRIGQVTVAKSTNLSEATISRWKENGVAQCSEILAACQLKVVAENMHCYSEDYIEHLHYFAQIGMKAAPDLIPGVDFEL